MIEIYFLEDSAINQQSSEKNLAALNYVTNTKTKCTGAKSYLF